MNAVSKTVGGNQGATGISTLGRWPRRLALALLVAGVLGCSSPKEKANEYFENGMALLAKGSKEDLAKADLEFRNALQLEKTMTKAIYGLAVVAERQGDWQKLFNLLNKVVEQDPKHLEARVKLGRLLLAAGQLDKALEASNAVLELNKDDANVLALRAAVLFKLDDKKGAVEQANLALSKDENNIDALVVLATERLSSDDPAKAVEYLDRGLKLNEKNVALQLIKIQALDKMAQQDLAEAVFRKLIKLYPDVRAFRHALAQYLMRHERQKDAEAEYRAIAAENPKDLEAKLDVVRFMNTLKGAQAARQELEAFIKQDPGNNELKFALAGLHQSQNDSKSAEAILGAISARDGNGQDGIKAKGLLAASLLSRREQKAGLALVGEILKADPRNEQGLILKASSAIDTGQLDQAIADLRTILRDVPDSARALLLLGKAHELAAAPQLAEDHYLKAFQASKLSAPFGMAYAEFLLKRNSANRAGEVLKDVLRAAPGHVPAMKMLAQVHISQGDWTSAQELADEIRRRGDKEKVSDQIMGAIFAGKKNYAESISAFKRAVEAAPSEVQPIVALVRTYVRAGKIAEAASFLNSVLQANPANINARLLQGQLYLMKGDHSQAAQSFSAVIGKEPKNPIGYRNLANAHMQAKHYDEADKVIVQGLAAEPGDFGLRLTRAGNYELAGRFEDAIKLYEELLKERPNADVLANNLASLLSEHRSDKASLNKAYELAQRFQRSDVPQFKDTLGWAKHKVGKTDEAAALLESATEKLPDMAVFRYHLGMNYLAMANKEAARKELQKALDLARDQPLAQSDLIRKALQGL